MCAETSGGVVAAPSASASRVRSSSLTTSRPFRADACSSPTPSSSLSRAVAASARTVGDECSSAISSAGLSSGRKGASSAPLTMRAHMFPAQVAAFFTSSYVSDRSPRSRMGIRKASEVPSIALTKVWLRISSTASRVKLGSRSARTIIALSDCVSGLSTQESMVGITSDAADCTFAFESLRHSITTGTHSGMQAPSGPGARAARRPTVRKQTSLTCHETVRIPW
mmetsp:Transcript_11345/g.36193  ORF Transcript_11345/g.36193 Transcript_11345/m.36193 type:complete len:225 (+) Transcript_11345:676-1350(+)